MASPQSLRKPPASNGFRDGPARLDVLGLVPIVCPAVYLPHVTTNCCPSSTVLVSSHTYVRRSETVPPTCFRCAYFHGRRLRL